MGQQKKLMKFKVNTSGGLEELIQLINGHPDPHIWLDPIIYR
jgi:ABC-type Zn uptake system ZnuABC Zn-binding protein ZnuA